MALRGACISVQGERGGGASLMLPSVHRLSLNRETQQLRARFAHCRAVCQPSIAVERRAIRASFKE